MSNSPAFTTSIFKTVGFGKGGVLYAGTANAGFYRFKDTSWQRMTVLTNHNINDIQTDRNGGIWVAQSGTTGGQAITGGVNYFPDSSLNGFSYYGATAGLPSRNCRGIFIDTAMLNQGNPRVWTANLGDLTNSGAVGLGLNSSSPFFNKITAGIDQTNGLGSTQTIGGNHSEIWAFSNANFGKNQIVRYNAITAANIGAYDYTNTAVLTSSFTAKAIYFDSHGRQWIGLSTNGIIVKDGANWTLINMPQVIPAASFVNNNAISEDRYGTIYIGTSNGLILYKGGSYSDTSSYERYTYLNGLPSSNVADIAEDPTTGNIILATNFGIAVWNKNPAKLKAELLWDYSGPQPTALPLGVAADGVSRLYIKIQKGTTDTNNRIQNLSISIKDTVSRTNTLFGRLKKATVIKQYSDEATNGGSSVVNIADTSSDGKFWVWYRSPTNFSTDNILYNNLSERTDTIRIVATYMNNQKDTVDLIIRIVRPPLILVHGLASGPSCWDSLYYANGITLINSPLFKHKNALELSGKAKYIQNAKLLMAGDYLSFSKTEKLKSTLQGNIDEMKNRGYAANQVDYVCHSMGGLMLRSAIQNQHEKFFANDLSFTCRNYGKGLVHKMITINTPHNGSPVADAITEFVPDLPPAAHLVLSEIYNHWPNLHKPFDWIEKSDPSSLFSTFQATPAVKNLQVSTAKGGIKLDATPVKNHLILGDVDYNTLSAVGGFVAKIHPYLDLLDHLLDVARDKAVPPVKYYLNAFYYIAYKPARVLGFIEWYSQQKGFSNFLGDGDLIVPLASQTARQSEAAPNISKFYNSPGAILPDAFHSSMVARLDVGQRVMQLLNSPVQGNLFSDTIPGNVDPEPPVTNSPVTISNIVTTFYDTTKIKLNLGPTISYADSTLSATINLKDTVGLAYIRLYFQDNDTITVSRNVAQQFIFKVNPALLGPQFLRAVAVYDLPTETVYHVDSISITVQTLATLQGFRIQADTINLTANETYYPEYEVKYNGEWVHFDNANGTLSVTIQNPLNLSYNSQNAFVGIQPLSTKAYFNYQGFKDTVVFNTYLPLNSNCINKTIASGNLKNPAIWSKGIKPDICDSIVIEAGHNIIADTTAYFRSMRINSSGSLTIQDSIVRINIGDPDNANITLDNYGAINITKGTLNVNGQLNLRSLSTFNMTGGMVIIDGNNGAVNFSIPDGSHLFNVSNNLQSFSFTGGILQIIDPPLGINSQAINCPYYFGVSSTVKFGNGISTTGSNNPNGFGGNLFPAQIGKLVLDGATLLNNRLFTNINPLSVKTSVEVLSGQIKQQALITVGQ